MPANEQTAPLIAPSLERKVFRHFMWGTFPHLLGSSMATPGRRQWGGAHLDAPWAAICNRGAVCGRGAEAHLHTVKRQVAAGRKYLNLTAIHHAQLSLLACGGAPAGAPCGRQTKPNTKPKSCTEDMLLGNKS